MHEKTEQQTIEQLEQYFLRNGFPELVEASKAGPLHVNTMQTEKPYKPELHDLHMLHQMVIETKRTTILEFGCGWSTLVLSHALGVNRSRYDISHLRRNNPFEIHSVDNVKQWISVAKERLEEGNAHVHFSEVDMCLWDGKLATEYRKIPLINPDFIYLDGPDQFDVKGEINGFSTRHKDMMPMSCDILKMEWFLTPGTIIVVDGRTANARFLLANFQRKWTYTFQDDQHVFTLKEEPLGKHNENQMKFYNLPVPSHD